MYGQNMNIMWHKNAMKKVFEVFCVILLLGKVKSQRIADIFALNYSHEIIREQLFA